VNLDCQPMKRPPLYALLDVTGFRLLMRTLYRIEIRGAERVPATGAVILAANHESLADPWLLPLCTPRPVRYMAKAELWNIPLVGFILGKFGVFPVARGAGDRGAIGRAAELLEEGQVLGIFPQGTCLPFPDRHWYRGAAKLAIATGATIVPTCLVGTERAMRPGKFKIGFPRIRILVGEPIEVAKGKPNLAAAKALTDRIEAVVEELRAPYGPPAHAWYPPREPAPSSS
jgi:1-acyl-sn-glycerol-3-phosphate acyltransferase